MSARFERYLRLLGIEGHPSGLSGLRTLVQRHLCVVPFENVSKLLLYGRERRGRVMALSEFLDGIEFSDLGGTCFTNNPFLKDLLVVLGYDADLLGADMSQPNVHTCVRVRIDSIPYHVDVGFAAPLREPVRLDRLPFQLKEGKCLYRLERDTASDGFRMSVDSGSEHRFGYRVHDPPRPKAFFDQAVSDSYALSSTFMQCLRISRVFPGYSVDLVNRELRLHAGGETTVTALKSMLDLKAALHDQLRIPRCPIESAIAELERLTGRPFFREEGDGTHNSVAE